MCGFDFATMCAPLEFHRVRHTRIVAAFDPYRRRAAQPWQEYFRRGLRVGRLRCAVRREREEAASVVPLHCRSPRSSTRSWPDARYEGRRAFLVRLACPVASGVKPAVPDPLEAYLQLADHPPFTGSRPVRSRMQVVDYHTSQTRGGRVPDTP